MKRLPGQALGWLNGITRVLLAMLLVLALGVAWLAWRLNEGPLPVPLLARQIERAVNPAAGGTRLQVREAAIAWEGFRSGASAPLDIRLSGVRVVEAGGAVRAELPDAAATLALGALLAGRVVPATIELRRPSVLVFRGADGQVGLDLGGLSPAPTATPTEAPAAGVGNAALQVLAALMQPASEQGSYTALRRLRLVGGEITVVDQGLGRTWALLDPQLDIRREAGGGLVLDGGATLRLGELDLPVRLSGQALGSPMRGTVGLTLPALSPRDLARAIPALAPLGVLDAPLSLGAFVDFDASGTPHGMRARLTAGAGTLEVAPGRRLGFSQLEATAAGDSQALDLREARLRLPGEAGRPGPELLASGQARLVAGVWQAALETRLAALPLAELHQAWPQWAAPEWRAQVLPRLVGGRLRQAEVKLALRLPESLEGLDWQQAEARVALDQPVLELSLGDRRPAESLELVALATPSLLRVERLALRLPGPQREAGPRSEPTLLLLDAEATRQGAGWQLAAHATLDQLDLADLSRHWPEGVATAPRGWLTQNLTAGLARNGRWTLAARLPASLNQLELTGLAGGMDLVEATVHWLRPVPPLAGASGTVEFGLKEIIVRAQGARQLNPDGSRGNLVARDVTLRFHGLDAEPGYLDMVGQIGGPLTELVAVLRHPRLKLFEKRPLELNVRGGQIEARLNLVLPLLNDLPIEQLRLRAAGRVSDGRLQDIVLDKDLDRATLELAVDTESLKLSGEARLDGTPVRLGVELDFRGGPTTQVIERATVTGRADATALIGWGLDPGRVLVGPLGLEVRYERRRNGQGSVTVGADLRHAVLAFSPIGWSKPAGTPGSAEVVLRLAGNTLQAADSFRVEALELAVRGRIAFGRGAHLERVDLVDSLFGGSRMSGEVRPPAQPGGAWQVNLRGPLLDLRPMFGPSGHVAGGAAGPGRAEPAPRPETEPDASNPPLALDLRFDRVTMGLGRDLANVQARARSDALGLLREARVTGSTGPNAGFEATLVPRGQQRVLRLQAADGGALLRALDLVQPVQGGRLLVNAVYEELRPGAALVGTAELDGFVVRDAPSVGKILQAMTLYGLVDVLSGPGLNFARLVAPFRLTPEALELTDARAFSASLGVTAKGRVLRERTVLELEGTIVPAYMFNSLLGNIPLLGRIFSPETGGGLFAATWRVQGPVEAPQVTMNPLAALTPGFLRGLFGIVEGPVGQGRR